jgi:hypothetical protein
MARLKTQYLEQIRPQLQQQLGYSSVMQVPKIEKITLNMGVGEAKQDSGLMNVAPLIRAGNAVIPIGLKLPINSLAAGGYRVEVKAVDSTGNSSVARLADFDIE